MLNEYIRTKIIEYIYATLYNEPKNTYVTKHNTIYT